MSRGGFNPELESALERLTRLESQVAMLRGDRAAGATAVRASGPTAAFQGPAGVDLVPERQARGPMPLVPAGTFVAEITGQAAGKGGVYSAKRKRKDGSTDYSPAQTVTDGAYEVNGVEDIANGKIVLCWLDPAAATRKWKFVAPAAAAEDINVLAGVGDTVPGYLHNNKLLTELGSSLPIGFDVDALRRYASEGAPYEGWVQCVLSGADDKFLFLLHAWPGAEAYQVTLSGGDKISFDATGHIRWVQAFEDDEIGPCAT